MRYVYEFCRQFEADKKRKKLSQEDLAELLDVSRQAVSKWEQEVGYPEVEKLLLLSEKLNVSLDSLMATEIAGGNNINNTNVTGHVIIKSRHENVIADCHKVISSQKMKGGKKSPQYALFGVDSGHTSFWGESTTFLGWYTDKEQIAKEIADIQNAIINGILHYELKYSVRVERHWLSVKIAND